MTKSLSKFSDYSLAVMNAMASVDQKALEKTIVMLQEAFNDERKVFVCGNGGSAAIANHLTCDCMKGIATDNKFGHTISVTSLACNVPLITAIANDIGYDQIFSKQLEYQAESMDILIAISSSGNSPNIIEAINTAKELNMFTISITGFTGGKAEELAGTSIHIKSDNYGVIEDVSQSIMHYISQALRRNLSHKSPEDINY